MKTTPSAEAELRLIIEAWAAATRLNQKNDILKNHAEDLVIFDVLPPMKYESTAAYRRSWDKWQPETQGDVIFELEDLVITGGQDVAFAYGFIRCGGTMPDGQSFNDLVRATFCFRKIDGHWKIQHQHVSKPYMERRSAHEYESGRLV
jgi:ketosteroid isomerase-like protein